MAKDKDWSDAAKEDPEKAKAEFDELEANVLQGADITILEDHNPEIKALNELNSNHIFIQNLGGKSAVSIMTYSEVTEKEEIDFISVETFKNIYMNRTIVVGQKPISIAIHWLLDSRRNTVNSITFDPSTTDRFIEINDKRYLNLWVGMGLAPKKGCWNKTRKHIWKILCNSDPIKFKYVMKWLAFCVQHPETRAEVALVFKGEKGAGKSFLFEQFKTIFGSHGMVVSDPNRLVGKFNNHFRSLCFLFCDEAYFPGDKEAEGIMKSRITSEFIDVEAKGRDPITLRNRLHIVMCTNKDLVIPATKDERRFFIEATNDMYAKNRAPEHIRKKYFDALFMEARCGGKEAMLYDLIKVKLENWHPRDNVPETQELAKQKDFNLNHLQNAVKQMLEEGLLPGELRNTEYIVTSESLYNYLEKLEPHCAKFSMVRKANMIKTLGAIKARQGGTGKTQWVIPTLKEMRRGWDTNFGPNAWDELEEWVLLKTEY